MKRISDVLSALFFSSLLLTSAVAQEDPNLSMSRPEVGIVIPNTEGIGGRGVPAPYGSGRDRSGTWIAASQFTVRFSSSAPVLTYDIWHYYSAPGMLSPTRYFAQVDLEPGVLIDMFTCVYNDSSATNDVWMSLQKYTTDLNTTPPTRNGGFLATASSSGSPGVEYKNVSVSPNETYQTLSGNILRQYYLGVDIAQDTSLAGCWVFWTRQISPAPATASFTDVPTSFWAFQAIEALKASNITVGCNPPANTQFCPNGNVTRAEMATFLARGLGLNWPDSP